MALLSKELLGEVLGREVKSGRIDIYDNTLTFAYENEDMWSDINIYELANLCKEWAFTKNLDITTSRTNLGYIATLNDKYGEPLSYIFDDLTSCYAQPDIYINYPTLHNEYDIGKFYAKTEPESVFKVCKWVHDQIKEK